jgi:hypothetical protein
MATIRDPKFTARFNIGNAAFGETAEERDDEVARIRSVIAAKVAAGETDGAVLDLNGNTVGRWETR